MEEENFFGESDSDNENQIQKQLKTNINAAKDDFAEDLMGDADDREHLQGLTELQREEILMQRHAKREEHQRKKELLDKMSRQKVERSGRRGGFDDLKVNTIFRVPV